MKINHNRQIGHINIIILSFYCVYVSNVVKKILIG
jgi:hypothetical protein